MTFLEELAKNMAALTPWLTFDYITLTRACNTKFCKIDTEKSKCFDVSQSCDSREEWKNPNDRGHVIILRVLEGLASEAWSRTLSNGKVSHKTLPADFCSLRDR